MIRARKFVLYTISLVSMFVSLFFMLIIFLPNTSLVPESSLLTELQEVGPLLLSPIIGEDLLLHDPDCREHLQEPFPNLLLMAMARYVGALGFSRSVFYESMCPIWTFIMTTCMSLSFSHFCASVLMLHYIILPKKHPNLLLPWICFNIVLLGTALVALVSLKVALVTSLNKVEAQNVHCYTILILCLTSLFLFAQIFQVLAEFTGMKRITVNMTQMTLQEKEDHMTANIDD